MKKQQAEIEQVEVEKNRASGAVQSSRRVALAREANIRACLVDFEVHTRVFMNSLSAEIIQELNLRQQELVDMPSRAPGPLRKEALKRSLRSIESSTVRYRNRDVC